MSLTQITSHGIADGAIVNADLHTNADLALSKLNTSGTASSSTFLRGDGAWTAIDLSNLSASNLTSGTVPDARFPSTLPALNGSALTALNASNLASGTVGTARLGSGTASSSTFLRGDGSWQTISADGGNAATLDSIDSSQFLRSDADDTASGKISFTSSSDYPVNINGSDDAKILLQGSNNPYIRFRESSSNKAYIQWNASGYLEFRNQEDSSSLLLRDDLSFSTDSSSYNTVWHAGNDGSGSGLDADTLDGTQAAKFLSSYDRTTTTGWEDGSRNFRINAGGTGSAGLAFHDSAGTFQWQIYGAGGSSEYGFLNANWGGWDIRKIAGGALYVNSASQVWHAGNDGAGSGLDADSVDGIGAASFLRSDAAASFTGGTLTIAGNNALRFQNGSWSGDNTKIQHHSNWLYLIGGSNGFIFRHTDGNNRWQIDSSGHFYPSTSGNLNIGSSTYKVDNGYFDWLYSDSGDRSDTKPTRFYASDDGWLRYYDARYMRMWLGLSAKDGNYARRDYTSDTNYWVGAASNGTVPINDCMGKGNVFWDTWSNPSGQPSGTSHWTGFNCLHYTNRGTDGTSSGGAYGWQMTMGAGSPSLTYLRGNWSSSNLGTPTWYKVWNEANDGSGSGLDADTVDGYEGSRLVINNTANTVSGAPWELNNSGTSGWAFRFHNSTGSNNYTYLNHGTHGPHIRNDSATNSGYLLEVYQSGASTFKVRGGDGLVTSGGNTMWHAGNDGSGSGLDADTVDGVQLDSLVRKGHNSNYILHFGSGTDSNHVRSSHPYAIFQEDGAWSGTYPDLCISHHTGIKIGCGYQGYGGLRFTPDYNSETILMSINNGTETNGNGNVKVNTRLYVSSILDCSSTVRCDDWYYNDTGGEGLYSSANGMHWYADATTALNAAGGTSANWIRFRDESGGTVRGYVGANSSNLTGFLDHNGNWRFYITSSYCASVNNFIPNSDNTYDCGLSNARWDDIYATNGTIQTSDRNEKENIVATDLGLAFVNKLSPKSFKRKGKNRTHYGFIAQDIEQIITDLGKTTTQFAPLIKSDISEEKDGSKYSYGLRYDELLAPIVKAIQELAVKVAALESA